MRMSEFKGTPGPWNIIRDNRSGEIVSIGPAYSEEYAGTCWIEVSQANDNLIAAAPDLLEALIPTTKLEMWTESADDDELVIMSVGTVRKMRAAVAKALGENK